MLHGQTRHCLPSLFLDELPVALLLRINPTPIVAPAAFVRSTYGGTAAGGSYAASPGSGTMAAKAYGGLRIGQNVDHARFGAGVIVAADGSGDDARVQVNFGAAGMKWLALAYAKLTPH
jgi:DNA helicase-2/ATP-dependent DNA helicase PcrA